MLKQTNKTLENGLHCVLHEHVGCTCTFRNVHPNSDTAFHTMPC